MMPSAAAGAPRVLVSRLGSSEVGTSCPMSASRLAAPIPRTPGVSQRSPATAGGSGMSLTAAGCQMAAALPVTGAA